MDRFTSFRKLVFTLILSQIVFTQIVFATLHSRTTQGTSWQGNVEISSLSRKITVHKYFLDIEEDIELIPTGWREPPNNLNTLEIYGTFNMPANTVITGILIWDGDNLLRGKLKGKENARLEYEEVVDRNTTPPPRPRDPILIEKLNSSNFWDLYNCAIYPVEWGKARKIRIRYLVPQKFINNEPVMQIPFGMSGEVRNTRSIELNTKIQGYSDIEIIELRKGNKTEVLNLPQTITYVNSLDVYNSTFVKIPDQPPSQMFKTSFEGGDWNGSYIMYWGQPPDSLLVKSGLRRETIFLWKWNFWHTFVYNDNGTKTISPFGSEAITQASKIYQSNIEITSGGDKVALMLDKGSAAENKLFPLSKSNTNSFDSLQNFLLSINSDYLLENIDGTEPPVKIRISEGEKNNFFKRGAESFDVSLKVIYNLFSEHEKVIKHIVFLSAGPVPDLPNLDEFYNNSDEILRNKITFSAYGSSPRYPTGYWPGVPIHRLVEKHALLTEGVFSQNFWIPKKKEAFFKATISNYKKDYNVTLLDSTSVCLSYYNSLPYQFCQEQQFKPVRVDTLSFAGHSTSHWENSIEWKAFDFENNLLGSYTEIPNINETPKDTFLVKLWAGAANAVTDTSFLSNKGARFGIVDEQYSLLALEQDLVSEKEKKNLEDGGLPFLSDDEIFLSKPLEGDENNLSTTPLAFGLDKFNFILLPNNSFQIIIPANERFQSVKIYDLKGKVVYNIPISSIEFSNSIKFINKNKLLKGVYSVIVKTNKNQYIRKFNVM